MRRRVVLIVTLAKDRPYAAAGGSVDVNVEGFAGIRAGKSSDVDKRVLSIGKGRLEREGAHDFAGVGALSPELIEFRKCGAEVGDELTIEPKHAAVA